MRVVRATADDALVVAALTLQHARAEGADPELGYLDRAAAHWLKHEGLMPTWIAEHEGSHAGLLQGSLVPLPAWPGRPAAPRCELWVHCLYVHAEHADQGIQGALLEAARAWAEPRGYAVRRPR